MSEKGWFHPDRGYWQTTGDVPDYVTEGYPEGTVEAPLKPGDRFEFSEADHGWVSLGFDADAKLQLAKMECRRRIYAVASPEAQTNIGATVSIIASKSASARTAEEKDVLVNAAEFYDWVADMRATASVLGADERADIKFDELWPVCAAGALSLIASS